MTLTSVPSPAYYGDPDSVPAYVKDCSQRPIWNLRSNASDVIITPWCESFQCPKCAKRRCSHIREQMEAWIKAANGCHYMPIASDAEWRKVQQIVSRYKLGYVQLKCFDGSRHVFMSGPVQRRGITISQRMSVKDALARIARIAQPGVLKSRTCSQSRWHLTDSRQRAPQGHVPVGVINSRRDVDDAKDCARWLILDAGIEWPESQTLPPGRDVSEYASLLAFALRRVKEGRWQLAVASGFSTASCQTLRWEADSPGRRAA